MAKRHTTTRRSSSTRTAPAPAAADVDTATTTTTDDQGAAPAPAARRRREQPKRTPRPPFQVQQEHVFQRETDLRLRALEAEVFGVEDDSVE